jgi:hypothetical protein
VIWLSRTFCGVDVSLPTCTSCLFCLIGSRTIVTVAWRVEARIKVWNISFCLCTGRNRGRILLPHSFIPKDKWIIHCTVTCNWYR